MKHTQGEWEIEPRQTDLEVTIKCEDVRICEVKSFSGSVFNDPETKEANANAKLIAAAPDLLEALHAMLSRFESTDIGYPKADHVKQLAEKAIKKATE